MNYRNTVLQDTTSINTAGTTTIDLDLKDIITRLMIVIEVVNTSDTPANHPLAVLKKIEVLDGSEVLFSLEGYQAQALSYYQTGYIDHNELNYENVAVCRASVTLNFGRYLYDEVFALDPNKYRNLQLRIEHNKALGGCTPTAGTIRVLADLFDQRVVTPVGFLGAKEIFSYVPTAGATEYITLPTQDSIRMLIAMNTNDNEEPDIQFESVKIDEDDGKRVIFDGLCMDLIRMEANRQDRFTEYLSGRTPTSGISFYLSACKDIQLGVIGSSGTQAYFHGAWSGGRKRSIKGSATIEFGGQCSGRCPHGAVPIFFGRSNEPDDWWDVGRVGKARVQLTPRVSGSGGCDTNKTNDLLGQFAYRY